MIALVGQGATQSPQPVHASASIVGRRRSSSGMASSGQAKTQLEQKTPSQAMHWAFSSWAVPILLACSPSVVTSGQIAAQSPQNVQPLCKRLRYTRAGRSASRRIRSSGQARKQGAWQSMQGSSSPGGMQGGGGPAGSPRARGNTLRAGSNHAPRRKARRSILRSLTACRCSPPEARRCSAERGRACSRIER